MLQRVDAMESELSALIESLRTGANRLNADLALLEGNLGELYEAAGGEAPRGGQAAAEQPAPAVQTAPAAPPQVDVAEEDEVGDEEPPAAVAPPAPAAPAVEPAPAATGDNGGEGGDVEGARLIALNMALNGQSREETDRYLAENFDLPDRAGLLDEVYESVGG